MYSSVGVVPPGSGLFVTVVLFSLWRLAPDSFSESARSDSRFRRGWRQESRPLWPLSVAHLFIWNDEYFVQPLPQMASDREDSSSVCAFFSNAPTHQRDTPAGAHPSFFTASSAPFPPDDKCAPRAL